MLAVACFMGLLLAVIAGFFIWHGTRTSYVSSKQMEQEAFLGENAGSNENGSFQNGEAGREGNAGSLEENDGARGGISLPEEDGKARGDASSPEGEIDLGGNKGAGGREDGSREGADAQLFESQAEETSGEDNGPIRLVFAGDVLLSDHVLAAYEQGGGIRGVVDEGLQTVIDSSDLFMVNEEFPFSSRGKAAEDKQFTFRLAPEKVSLFHEMGIDIVTLANNHALDFGTDALVDTCDVLDEAGIYRVGAGRDLEEARKPVILEVKGKKIGFLGASRVIPVGSWNATATTPGMLTTYDPTLLLEDIRKVRESCDYVVVYVHWGIERRDRPEEYQRGLGKQYIDAGADLVIGSHPHVLQGMEYYKGKPIVYSLGNFVFGSSIPKTALLTAEWDGEETTLSLTPGTSSAGYTRALTGEQEKQDFYQYITGLSYGAAVSADGVIMPVNELHVPALYRMTVPEP